MSSKTVIRSAGQSPRAGRPRELLLSYNPGYHGEVITINGCEWLKEPASLNCLIELRRKSSVGRLAAEHRVAEWRPDVRSAGVCCTEGADRSEEANWRR